MSVGRSQLYVRVTYFIYYACVLAIYHCGEIVCIFVGFSVCDLLFVIWFILANVLWCVRVRALVDITVVRVIQSTPILRKGMYKFRTVTILLKREQHKRIFILEHYGLHAYVLFIVYSNTRTHTLWSTHVICLWWHVMVLFVHVITKSLYKIIIRSCYY